MKHRLFTFNPVQENTYLLWDEQTLEAAIVDAGAWNSYEEQQLADCIASNGLKLKYALQTHMHFDHIFGLPFIHRTYGLSPIFHVDDLDIYRQMPEMIEDFGLTFQAELPPAEKLVNDGAELTLGTSTIRFLHTPGHTPGSASLYIPDATLLLSGDTLFRGSIGRTDLPGGNPKAELDSIRQKLLCLPDETTVLPGHGPSTTIGWEKQYNYFFAGRI